MMCSINDDNLPLPKTPVLTHIIAMTRQNTV